MRLLDFAASTTFKNGVISRTSAAAMRDFIHQISNNRQATEFDMPHIDVRRLDAWISEVNQSTADNSKGESLEISAFIVAAVYSECTNKKAGENFRGLTFEADISIAQGQYAAYKSIVEIERFGSYELFVQIQNVNDQISTVKATVDSLQSTFATRLEANNLELRNTQATLIEIESIATKLQKDYDFDKVKHLDDLADLAVKSTEIIKNHEQTITERLNLQSVRQRWQNVRDRAKIAFYTSLTIVVVMALSAIGIAFAFAQSIIDFLTPLNVKTIMLQGTVGGAIGMQLARIAVITIPLVCYLWIMKIAVRILMRSLMLMDDADQRATIMESYYTLANDGKTDERALPMMLWALFRPVPGHGPDGVEPPDFTEAINAGLKGKLLDPR